jgi:hypothetical protein
MTLPVRIKYRVTRWADPDELIETRHCRMCYRRWLTHEGERRLDKSLQDAWVEVWGPDEENEDGGKFGQVALFVWKDTIKPIMPEEEEV